MVDEKPRNSWYIEIPSKLGFETMIEKPAKMVSEAFCYINIGYRG